MSSGFYIITTKEFIGLYKMKYLSLFTGIGGFELGIHQAFKSSAECIGFSEVDKNAMKVYQSHFPSHPPLGDVRQIDFHQFTGKVDLIVGGSPCQDLSQMNLKRQGLSGNKSKLIEVMFDAIRIVKPKYFLLENVNSMTQANKDIISAALGVQPVMINACFFGAQNRKRLCWCDFPLPTPTVDNRTALVDILDPKEDVVELEHSEKAIAWIKKPYNGSTRLHHYGQLSTRHKSKTILASYQGVPNNVLHDLRFCPPLIRRFSMGELEELQGFPRGWVQGRVGKCASAKCLGNAVNAQVSTYIFANFYNHYLHANVMTGGQLCSSR